MSRSPATPAVGLRNDFRKCRGSYRGTADADEVQPKGEEANSGAQEAIALVLQPLCIGIILLRFLSPLASFIRKRSTLRETCQTTPEMSVLQPRRIGRQAKPDEER